MAGLRFFYGTMGSGKSTQALQINHNLTSRGLRTLLCTQMDRMAGRVSSRLGATSDAVLIEPSMDLFALATDALAVGPLHAIICDESQFYQTAQIEQLARIVDHLHIDVYAFGLLTSFQGRLFPASARLLELADERSELQVEMRCWCGRRATHNARLVNGVQVYDGQLMVIGDTTTPDQTATTPDDVVTYDLRCRAHWMAGLDRLRGEQLELGLDASGDEEDSAGPPDASASPPAAMDLTDKP
jgi:thymidine kinase